LGFFEVGKSGSESYAMTRICRIFEILSSVSRETNALFCPAAQYQQFPVWKKFNLGKLKFRKNPEKYSTKHFGRSI